jgi:glycosyltransferase involved in cell wall biosynthesis
MSRLALIAGTDPLEEVSGHRTYVLAHALAAEAAGFAPHVFAIAPAPRSVRAEFGTVHRIASPIRMRRTIVAAAHLPILASAVSRFLAGDPGPHMIHSFGAWASTGVAASRTLARRGVEAVPIASAYTTLDHESEAKVSGLAPPHGLRQRLAYRISNQWVRAIAAPSEQRGYVGSARVLVNYESVRHLLRDVCGPAVDIRRVPYAAPAAFRPDADRPTPLPAPVAGLRPADAPLIVSVSRHDPRKGVDVLLLALARLASDGVPARACLVGPGPLLAAHRRLADELRLGDRVVITGRVDDVVPYLHAADIFVLPSLEEGSGSVSLLEALQSGTAIVASRCDGIPEDLTDERDALLVPPGDVAGLQAALTRLLRDPTLRGRLATHARSVYETRFSADALVSALAETYADFGLRPT